MAKVAIILAVVAAIGVTHVELVRREDRARYEVHRSLTTQVMLRRRLWDQWTRIGQLLSPEQVKRRTVEMALDLTDEDESRRRVAERRRNEVGGGRE